MKVNATMITRRLMTNSEMKLVQQLEQNVWNMEPIPLHQTLTASQNGGLVLGAFFNEELVGFSYGFAGFNQGKAYLCSHMLGIDPGYRGKGIGASLKHEQKALAREMGYDLIVWTFDPLETRNGYLNLSKLHAICSTYVEDCYGEMDDNFNSGMPSDRFKVEWWINSSHIEKELSVNEEQAQSIFSYELTETGLPKLINSEMILQGIQDNEQPILVPVPAHFQELKSQNYELALDWRYKTREIFQTLFAKGYAVVSIVKSDDKPVHQYLLVQKHTLEI
ncbi:GNAT family N-acetyltransferase [Peribacillus asahii]|uniref:GNAT family N-acetyltransferase n=1 Tax=Peribacillus asahii TaxID=228899 RepID=UPI0037F3FAA7